MSRRFSGVLAGTLLLNGGASALAQDLDQLQRRIDSIASQARAAIGVGIIHVETGREVYRNGDQWFPLASTYKVPMAVEVLTRVDRGTWKLDSMVALSEHDLVPFGSLLTDRFGGPGPVGGVLSIRRYLELMLTLSDNSATDVLLRLMGGTAPVRERLVTLGIEGLTVSRSVQELGADWIGFPLPRWEERTLASLRQLMTSVKPAAHDSANRLFYASRKDHGTPRGMARLLAKIARREALSPAGTDVLLEIMQRDETGRDRIRALLPPGTVAATKTGTLAAMSQNDVGIVVLPDKTHLVIAVYTNGWTKEKEAEKNEVIAQIAWAAWRTFVGT
jgi:beta-lactamase class A